MITVKQNKQETIELLKAAIAKRIEEQDYYRHIIEESIKHGGATEGRLCLVEGGSDELIDKMKDCVFPPCDGERKDVLKLQWDQTLQHQKLSRIKDKDVRGCASHLHRITEHTQRIRSMAVFSDRICPLDEDSGRLFGSWARYISYRVLLQEAIDLGLDRQRQVLSAWLSALPIIMDLQAGEERNTIAERCQQAIATLQQRGVMLKSPE